MNIVTERKLERILAKEIYLIKTEIIANRTKKNRPPKNYAKVVIAARYAKIMAAGRSRSMNALTGSHRASLHPLLERKLKLAGCKLLHKPITLFKVEHKYGKTFFFGTCAEDDVVDKIITQYESNYKKKKGQFKNLNEIYFTKARRPRTWEIRPCCIVCQTIFS